MCIRDRWAQFLPYVILIVLLIAFWCFMMNKQSGGGAGPMQFGKARAKLAQDLSLIHI